MTTISDPRPAHRAALELAGCFVRRVTVEDLGRDTPCAGWDLRALLRHMVGQNHGFAAAVAGPEDVGIEAFAPRELGADPAAAWDASVRLLSTAFDDAELDRTVLLAELSTEQRIPAGMAIGFHTLDTVVHGWDVAEALALPYRPSDGLVALTGALAEQVPTGGFRDAPGAPFAPVVHDGAEDADPWHHALALLGRTARSTVPHPA